MSSGFSGGYPDFYTAGGMNGRSMININNPQGPYRSPLSGILSDQSSQIVQRRPDLTGKRSLFEYQQKFQQQQQLGIYLRNVKQRANYHQQANSPISPLSPPVDFSGNSLSPDISSITSSSSSSISTRYGLPIFQQLRQPQPGGMISSNHLSGAPFQNLVQNQVGDSEKKMMNRLHELERQLFDDIDEEQGDAASAVTNSQWSEAIQSLIGPGQKPISPSPTSSSSSCSSSSASPPVICPKQSLTEAASAICEGKIDVAVDTITRVSKDSNTRGTSKQRLMAYMVSALRSRLNPTEYPPPVRELYGKDHTVSVQMLYEISPCFKLGFMAANLAILEAISDEYNVKLHVIDFEIGQGVQYLHLLHALAAKKAGNKFMSLKITTFLDYSTNCDEARLKVVGDAINALAEKVGVSLCFKVMNLKISELNPEGIGLEADEILAVNLAFRLFKLPDESVTTENLRDELLRRVKGLSPKVVTVVEQEMNANTAPFVARVTEACGYYGALFDSLDATVAGDNPERVRIEEGLSRKMANSVACEGRDRVERCEVFGKWRARMGMAGFEARRLSQLLADSLRVKLNSGTRGNPGFTVKEEAGGICFGWMGRTLTVASAWC